MELLTTPAGRARATGHIGMPESEMKAYFGAVESAFNKNWLESSDVHRIQSVWHRDDSLATIELLTLGHAIVTMRAIDEKWVKGVVRKARGDLNKTHGWIFELIGAARFAGAGMDVVPMPANFKGHDIEIRFADGFTMNVSFKSHDISAHERGFQEGCVKLREVAATRFRGVTPSLYLRVGCTNHLEKIRMGAVHEWVNMLIGAVTQHNQTIGLGDTMMTWSAPKLGFNDAPLHPKYYSDTVQVFSRQHHREQLRFEKNIQEAEKKFERKANSCNVVVMRVHPTANLNLLGMYARAVLDEPNCKADAVWFYQPVVAHDKNATVVTHTVKPEIHAGRYSLGRLLKWKVLIGRVLMEPAKIQAVSDGKSTPIPDSYIFQQADHYSPMTKDEQGVMNGVASGPAPGVRIHPVFDHETGSVFISGKFPLHDELLIL